VNVFSVFYHLVVPENIYEWSSNVYSEDFYFDADASYATLFGVPTDPGVLVQWNYHTGEDEPRLICDVSGFGGTPLPLDLPSAPGDYWLPFSP